MADATPIDTSIVGNQKFLIQRDNLCAGALITPSAVQSVEGSVTADDPIRVGNSVGEVSLTGAYDGLVDTDIDIEIVENSGSTPRVSEPVFVGTGVGTTLTDAAASGVDSQRFAVTLTHKGLVDKFAKLDFYGFQLVSKIPGSAGNLIRVNCSAENLVYTASGNSTPAGEDMRQDDTRFTGAGYDFGGAYELGADGEVNALTKRFSFGGDPRVYRQYRTFEGQKEVYVIDPPIADTVKAETPVYHVTGAYTVTVSVSGDIEGDTAWLPTHAYAVGDGIVSGGKVFQVSIAGTSGGSLPSFNSASAGATTTDGSVTWVYVAATSEEVYSGLITLFDLLQSLLSSQLVRVSGPADSPPVIVQDRTPGGVDAEDIPFISSSYSLGFHAEGGDGIESITSIALDASSATKNERITITCKDNSVFGAEQWRVKGSGGGDYGTAITGRLFSAVGFNFVIPALSPLDETGEPDSNASVTTGDVSMGRTSFQANTGETQDYPDACVLEYALGAKAKPLTITFTYTLRPGAANNCQTAPITNHVNPASVGADTVTSSFGEGGTNLTAIPTTIQSRMSALWAWYAPIIDDLNSLITGDPGYSFESQVKGNLNLFSDLLRLYQSALIDLQNNPSALAKWDEAFLELKNDAELAKVDSQSDTNFRLSPYQGLFPVEFEARLNRIRVDAGLLVNPNDSTLGPAGPDDWWTDYGDDHWWVAIDSDGRRFPPMFTNQPWVMTKEVHDVSGVVSYPSLNEAAFLIGIGGAEFLTVGDSMEVVILAEGGSNGISDNRPFQVGDKFVADIVSRDALQLQNGVSGDNTQIWSVAGDVSGAFAAYTLNTASPNLYSSGGLQFRITPGEVANGIGDSFSFYVQSNQFRWRQDAGAWSSDTDIAPTVALINGLSAVFDEGAGVSFQPDDSFSFSVQQPYKADNSTFPDVYYWSPGVGTADIVYDFETDNPVDMIAIAWHSGLSSNTVTAQLLDASDLVLSTSVLTYSRDVMFHFLPELVTARKVKLSFSGASAFRLNWVWCGVALSLNTDADVLTVRYARNMLRSGAGVSGKHVARGYSGRIEWNGQWNTEGTTGFLSDADVTKLIGLFESVKSSDDQPLALIANPDYEFGWLFVLADDELESIDDYAYNLENREQRVQSSGINLLPVYLAEE